MSLSNPRIIFGIHSITPYNRTSKIPYGLLKVVGGANLALSSALEQLFAGSNRFAWAAESKTVDTQLTCKVKAYPGFLFSLFLGATVTDNAADTAGSTTTLTNATGTSLQSGTTGIASISVNSATKADLKFGKYVLKATSATAFKVYLYSDINLDRGTAGAYVGDDLEVAGPFTIVSGADTVITGFGLKVTGGSGTIAVTSGDTASFEVKPPSAGSTDIIVGKSTTSFPNFGALLLSQKRATGEMFEIDAPNCVGGGLPIDFAEQAFSQPELKMQMLYDSSFDKVFSIRHLTL